MSAESPRGAGYRVPDLPDGHSLEPVEVPDLLRAGRMAGWKFLGLTVLFVLLTAVTGLLAGCFAAILALAALGTFVLGLLHLFDPSQAFRHLGPSRRARLGELARVEEEMRSASTKRVELATGSLFFTDHWFVLVDKKNLVVEGRRELLWMWRAERRIELWVFRESPKYVIEYCTKAVTLGEGFSKTPQRRTIELHRDDKDLLSVIEAQYPHLLYGFRDDWASSSMGDLMALVDERRREME